MLIPPWLGMASSAYAGDNCRGYRGMTDNVGGGRLLRPARSSSRASELTRKARLLWPFAKLVIVIFNDVIHFSVASGCLYKSWAKNKFRSVYEGPTCSAVVVFAQRHAGQTSNRREASVVMVHPPYSPRLL